VVLRKGKDISFWQWQHLPKILLSESSSFEIMIRWLFLASVSTLHAAESAKFQLGINVGGPSCIINGQSWQGDTSEHFRSETAVFENQDVDLATKAPYSTMRMLRTSRAGEIKAEVHKIPPGEYQLFTYFWEDNRSESFDVLVNGKTVVRGHQSGVIGSWHKLGPFTVTLADGPISLETKGGTANLSGIELWQGGGPLPEPDFGFTEQPTPDQLAFFENKVRPVLVTHCYECHASKSKKLGGSLLLDSKAGIRKGGDTEPPVLPCDPENSLLLRAVRHQIPDLTMPPREKLPEEAVAVLEAWIRQGAPDPRTEDTFAALQAAQQAKLQAAREWWAFQPVKSDPPPAVKQTDWPTNAIDHFTLAKMEANGLAPAAPADKATWLRRVTFDLIGLPPTPGELDAFLQDNSARAKETVLDRLLANPAYGERWGRHWLDVVRYADTAGDNSDYPIPQHHRYRDWVISAFNADLPYDQFVQKQLAGDLLATKDAQERRANIIATGYLANARRFGSRVEDYPHHLTIEDTLDNLGRAFLGLSLSCARCHDHKFDPISADDYYGLYGIFSSSRYPWPGIELDKRQRDFIPLGNEALALAKTRERDSIHDSLGGLVKAKEQAAAGKQGKEAEALWKEVNTYKTALAKYVDGPREDAYAMAEAPRPADARVQLKGDPTKPQGVVKRRFPKVLGGQELPAEEQGSGRKQLASWITDPQNPLTARVVVNRIWQGHFGKPIVPTPNDFGRQGKAASHPELLDYLARAFIQEGWSIKKLHRQILLSSTAGQSSMPSAAMLATDPTNQWLSCFPRRRLDAEAIRDSLLQLSGLLDNSPAGEHPFPGPSTWQFTQHNPFKAVYQTNRRSVYLMTQRTQRHPFLVNFDGADPSASTPLRTTSVTPLQALFFLNDPQFHEQAQGIARQAQTQAATDDARLRQAWRHLFSRDADADELQQSRLFLAASVVKELNAGKLPHEAQQAAWEAQIRVLLRLNEFVYLD
jgi:hypothetical protein